MGQFQTKPTTNTEGYDFKDFNYENITVAASSMQGWRVLQEDQHVIELNFSEDCAGCHLFIVFDGHGGLEVSEYCMIEFKNILKKQEKFKDKKNEESIKEALINTFYQLNEFVCSAKGQEHLKTIYQREKDKVMKKRQLKKDEQKSDDSDATDKEDYNEDYQQEEKDIDEFHQFEEVGTTANVILIIEKKLYCANIGDTRAVLLQQDGEQIELSKDQKPDNEEEKQRIIAANGKVSKGRVNGNLAVARSIGDKRYKIPLGDYAKQMVTCHPVIKVFDLSQYKIDFIMLACDGIWECKKGQFDPIVVIQELIQKEATLLKAIQQLFLKCLARDPIDGAGCDNMTAIVIKFKN